MAMAKKIPEGERAGVNALHYVGSDIMQTPCNQGARLRQVSEDPTKLLFECEDESTLDVTLTIVFACPQH
jgi:hypothetical protein